MAEILLSIVIPTRNRHFYLNSCLQLCLSFARSDIEIVISDNSDSRPEIPELLAAIADRRVKYTYRPEPISCIDNVLLGLEEAQGKYVVCIGDDDALNLNIADICEEADRCGVEAMVDNWPAFYYWPNFREAAGATARAGTLFCRKFSGKIRVISASQELSRNVATGGVGLQLMPRVYLGVVRRTAVAEAVRRARASVQGLGTCPDMYLAGILSGIVGSVHVVDYPIIVPGTSAAGAGQLLESRTHQGRLRDAPHLANRKTFKWPTELPEFYSAETFCAESTVKALMAGGDSALYENFNFLFVYVLVWWRFPKERRRILQAAANLRIALRSQRRSVIWYILKNSIVAAVSLGARRLGWRRRLFGASRFPIGKADLGSAYDAAIRLQAHIEATGVYLRWKGAREGCRT